MRYWIERIYKINLVSLPPTENAERSILTALPASSNLTEWFGPRRMEMETTWMELYHSLLEFISCKCWIDCGRACGCQKVGLECTVICENCTEKMCSNKPEIIVDEAELHDVDEGIGDHCDEHVFKIIVVFWKLINKYSVYVVICFSIPSVYIIYLLLVKNRRGNSKENTIYCIRYYKNNGKILFFFK